jgi:hypothetical protein
MSAEGSFFHEKYGVTPVDIYKGNIASTLKDEEITVLFPNGIVAGEHAFVSFGSESNLSEIAKYQNIKYGKIIPKGRTSNGFNLSFMFDEARCFNAILSHDTLKLSLKLISGDGTIILASDLRLVSEGMPTVVGIASATVRAIHDLDAPDNDPTQGIVLNCSLRDGSAQYGDDLVAVLGYLFGAVGIGFAIAGSAVPTAVGVGFAVTSLALPVGISKFPWGWFVDPVKIESKQLNYGQIIQRTSTTGNTDQTLNVTWAQIINDRNGRKALEIRTIEKSKITDDTEVSLKQLIGSYSNLKTAGTIVMQMTIPNIQSIKNRSLMFYPGKNPSLIDKGTYFNGFENVSVLKDNVILQMQRQAYNNNKSDGIYSDEADKQISMISDNNANLTCVSVVRKNRIGINDPGLFDVSTVNCGLKSYIMKDSLRISNDSNKGASSIGSAGGQKDVQILISKYIDSFGPKNIFGFSWRPGNPVYAYDNTTPAKIGHSSPSQGFVYLPINEERPWAEVV